jgi:hypothetical protein
MPQNELTEVAELSQAKVRRKTCLHPFFSNNTNSNVSFLDHRDIVSSISDTSNSLASLYAQVLSYDSFLSR